MFACTYQHFHSPLFACSIFLLHHLFLFSFFTFFSIIFYWSYFYFILSLAFSSSPQCATIPPPSLPLSLSLSPSLSLFIHYINLSFIFLDVASMSHKYPFFGLTPHFIPIYPHLSLSFPCQYRCLRPSWQSRHFCSLENGFRG